MLKRSPGIESLYGAHRCRASEDQAAWLETWFSTPYWELSWQWPQLLQQSPASGDEQFQQAGTEPGR